MIRTGSSNSLSVLLYRGISLTGECIKLEACCDIMDLLYEKEETFDLFSSPPSLAASVLACLLIMFFFLFDKGLFSFSYVDLDNINLNMFITFGIISESFSG